VVFSSGGDQHVQQDPGYDQFGITAAATEQYVWYDHPDSAHR